MPDDFDLTPPPDAPPTPDPIAATAADCPECEICCAVGLCCPPASEAQHRALTLAIIHEGKWTDPRLASSLASEIIEAYFAHHTPAEHAELNRRVQERITQHAAVVAAEAQGTVQPEGEGQ